MIYTGQNLRRDKSITAHWERGLGGRIGWLSLIESSWICKWRLNEDSVWDRRMWGRYREFHTFRVKIRKARVNGCGTKLKVSDWTITFEKCNYPLYLKSGKCFITSEPTLRICLGVTVRTTSLLACSIRRLLRLCRCGGKQHPNFICERCSQSNRTTSDLLLESSLPVAIQWWHAAKSVLQLKAFNAASLLPRRVSQNQSAAGWRKLVGRSKRQRRHVCVMSGWMSSRHRDYLASLCITCP